MVAVSSASEPTPAAQRPSAERARILPSATRWSVPVSAPSPLGVVIADGKVVLALPPDHLAAYRLTDGTEVWRVELKPDQPLALADARAFVAAGEAIHAVRLEDGVSIWRTSGGALTAPLLAHEGWIIAATAGRITALRATDGSEVWQHPSSGQTERATIGGHVLYVPYSDGRVVAFDLLTGRQRWEQRFGGAVSEILAVEDRLYFGAADKLFYCLDADDGDLLWRTPRAGAAVRGRPAADAEHVYFASLDNMLRAVDRWDGAVRWQADLPFRPSAGPVLIGSVVFVPGLASSVPTFDARTGNRYQPISFGARLLAPPVLVETDKGPVAAALTGELTEEWRLVVFEQSTTIPVAALVPPLPGTQRPLPSLPPLPSIPSTPLKALPGITVPVRSSAQLPHSRDALRRASP